MSARNHRTMNCHRNRLRLHLGPVLAGIALLASLAIVVLPPSHAQAQTQPAAPTPATPAPAEAASPEATQAAARATLAADPLLHGAWLWQANCVRCHGDYADERVGEGLKPRALQNKISGTDKQGCATDWALTKGGPLSIAEIKDIAAYIGAWEAKGSAPDLAPLPPIPTPTARATATPFAAAQVVVATATPSVDPAIAALLKQDPVYEGAWLYAANCVVCHLGYGSARQAALNDDATLLDLVTNGKTATSMPAFGMLVGGQLRRAQIEAIVAYMRAWEDAGREPDLPNPIAAELARRTTLAAALPAMAGAPPAFAPTPAPGAAAATSTAPEGSRGGNPGLWGIFLMLSAIGAATAAGLFILAMVCTALVPPRRPPNEQD